MLGLPVGQIHLSADYLCALIKSGPPYLRRTAGFCFSWTQMNAWNAICQLLSGRNFNKEN
jgi:hypothetical protein